ncbi:hypothetical protein ElyMa_003549700 [Elysia marginata]|uniref:Uncharacterized protein n=1 Tax=Elysia marginata TaxID=1093978 RepID=A0AAV4EK61_9GAST|nr:hypothetical protein ElyMa_003549700 [Elysia marginata]
MRELNRDYQESCRDSKRRAVGWKLFNEAFLAQKLSIFIASSYPEKDQCDVYISAKLRHKSNEVHKRHAERKNAAQQEKEKAKTEIDIETSVWTMDLQSVLTCPKT